MKISINLPDKLIKEFNESSKEKGYTHEQKDLKM